MRKPLKSKSIYDLILMSNLMHSISTEQNIAVFKKVAKAVNLQRTSIQAKSPFVRAPSRDCLISWIVS